MNEIQDRFANISQAFAVFMYSFAVKTALFPEKDPPDGDIVLLYNQLKKVCNSSQTFSPPIHLSQNFVGLTNSPIQRDRS